MVCLGHLWSPGLQEGQFWTGSLGDLRQWPPLASFASGPSYSARLSVLAPGGLGAGAGWRGDTVTSLRGGSGASQGGSVAGSCLWDGNCSHAAVSRDQVIKCRGKETSRT